MSPSLARAALGLAAACLLLARQAVAAAAPRPWQEFLTNLTAEPAAARQQRHELIAARRAGPLVIVRRPKTPWAGECSFEACAAVMDRGGDGCVVELRRTADGVLVMFPDDTLDRLTDGFGAVAQIAFRDLENLSPNVLHGRRLSSPPPTFAALLDLARERIMLLHLELKEPGLEDQTMRLLDEADAWDHVTWVNPTNAARLRRHPNLRPLVFRAPDLHADRRDLDPLALAQVRLQPGEMLLVGDPRVAAKVLERDRPIPLPFTKSYRLTLRPRTAPETPATNGLLPMPYVFEAAAFWPHPSAEFLASILLAARPQRVAEPLPVDQANPVARLILERAWAAQRLGQMGERSATIMRALETTVRQPSPHPDERYAELDRAQAMRALRRLRATSAVPIIIGLLESVAEELAAANRAGEGRGALPAPGSARLRREALEALGELPCRRAKRFLKQYVSQSQDALASERVLCYETAGRALMQQRLAWDGIADLLRHTNSIVRAAALLECLNRPTEDRDHALRVAAPWARQLVEWTYQ